jgi:hypothetical protein
MDKSWALPAFASKFKKQRHTSAHIVAAQKRVWRMIKGWIKIESIDTNSWTLDLSIHTWWESMSTHNSPERKSMVSVTMVTSWTIWNERNARVFRDKSAPRKLFLKTIKDEASLWVAAGA